MIYDFIDVIYNIVIDYFDLLVIKNGCNLVFL